MTYQLICSKSNITDATSGAGTAYFSEKLGFIDSVFTNSKSDSGLSTVDGRILKKIIPNNRNYHLFLIVR
jgi:hypothetical protein